MKRDGIILILVLWVLFFLSVVVVTLSFKNRVNIRLGSLNNETTRMFYLARDGIYEAIIQLVEDDSDFDYLDDDWHKDFTLQKEEGLLSYKVVDEDRFININTAAKDLIDNLKIKIPELSDEVIAALISERPFNLKQEVLDKTTINKQDYFGQPNRGKIGLADLITVFSDGKININTASEDVLMVLPQMTEATVEAIINWRRKNPFKSNDTISEELSNLGLTAAQVSSLIKMVKVNSTAFFISSEVKSNRKNISKNLKAVVKRSPGGGEFLFFWED